MDKAERGEPEASMTFFSLDAAPRRLVLREGFLRRDASVASKRKRKKRLIRLQVHPYRC
jgi:hypothetical protein